MPRSTTSCSRPGLQPQERAAFLARLFEDLLNRRDEIGDGELGRTLRELQHRYFKPPIIDERGSGNFGSHWPQRLPRLSR